jgi:hypothetical protein
LYRSAVNVIGISAYYDESAAGGQRASVREP